MQTIYTYDVDGIYTGEHIIVDIYAPAPAALIVAPPAMTGSQVAQRSGNDWVVLEERPFKFVDPASLQAAIVSATQARLDTFAKTRAYDGILSACTYATSSVPKFMREGQDAVNARDQTWAALYGIMGQVQAGELPMPSGFADIEPLLPVLEWTSA